MSESSESGGCRGSRLEQAGVCLSGSGCYFPEHFRRVPSATAEGLAVAKLLKHGQTERHAIVSGVRAACVWLMPLDEHSVLQWLGAVQSGEMLTRGMPAYTFRSWRDRTKNVSPTVVMLAACNSLRHHLHGATLTSVHTGESGYRSATTRRRALKIPHTPGPGMVISLGWGLQKGEEV